VQQVRYCTVKNQQKLIASIKQALYNHVHDDWVVLVGVDFTLPFNEGSMVQAHHVSIFFSKKFET
jgi:hypothetical protein